MEYHWSISGFSISTIQSLEWLWTGSVFSVAISIAPTVSVILQNIGDWWCPQCKTRKAIRDNNFFSKYALH